MDKRNKKKLLFVIYDGIENSVFQSQVLKPLLASLKQDVDLEITLVSFESRRLSGSLITSLIPAHPRLHFVMFGRLPFFSTISLWLALYHMKRFFKGQHFDTVMCRGPLAGYVALHCLKMLPEQSQPDNVIVQARGLCAQEYRYAYLKGQHIFFKRWLHAWIYQALENVERDVFAPQKRDASHVLIESVSPALKDYLVQHFYTDPKVITIAQKDIPAHIDRHDTVHWKESIRAKLGIAHDATVYCYCGSFKPWQCIPEIIVYFIEQQKKNTKSFLLILTQDVNKFREELAKYQISQEHYVITSVEQEELFKFLAAADFGMLFREKDIINWVSRPTKMLEYQAAGLKIVHNNTIAWLSGKGE